ncbi:MAG: hypothetical protein MK324_00095 [Pirellulales bacterium]|nr:hypothetical protein [Pirellulales bacterium]
MSQVSNLNAEEFDALEQLLGYLNFSSGTPDPQFLKNLNVVWRNLAEQYPDDTWTHLYDLLTDAITHFNEEKEAFAQIEQARIVLEITFDQLLRSYFLFHQDLLFHSSEVQLFNAFFIGRAFEVVLQNGPDFQSLDTETLMNQFNDFIGFRPVATLETQKHEPYVNEWLRPVPLYIQGAGVCEGPYKEVIALTIHLLEQTEESILRQADFHPAKLLELAIDPRAYDFDHPVNKRPNHHFGMWDPHHIDNEGYYDRYIIQTVTLDSLMTRFQNGGDLSSEELLFEASAVLAGTILMASGISGWGPACHDSSTNLSTLMPRIAKYRDDFYRQLLGQIDREHRDRLAEEALIRHQPFGAARQHLNAQLTETRASQLEHIHLGQVFAFMGHHDAARDKVGKVPVPSARFRCRIACQLDQSLQALDNNDLEQAVDIASSIFYLIQRSIQCGAFVDPWNILGFDCQFSLFPAMENSVHDHRIDELIIIIEQFFALLSKSWSEAAASDNQELCNRIDANFHEAAQWWHKYAAHEVNSVHAADPFELYHAAKRVAEALNLWYKDNTSAGSVRFWAPYVELFDSPNAYSLVVHSLLEQGDQIASRALLINWVSEAENVPLEQNDSSYYILSRRWLLDVLSHSSAQLLTTKENDTQDSPHETWEKIRKYFDYLEANSESYWDVPTFELGTPTNLPHADDDFEIPEEDNEYDIFSAAYEDVSYVDTTDDGVEGNIFDTSNTNQDELLHAGEHIDRQLAFHDSLAQQWKIAGMGHAIVIRQSQGEVDQEFIQSSLDTISSWSQRLRKNRDELERLLESISSYVIAAPVGDFESMTEYDRQRITLESLMERVISTIIEVTDTRRILDSVVLFLENTLGQGREEPAIVEFQQLTLTIFAALIQGDQNTVRKHWQELLDGMAQLPLLYIPLSKGGDPQEIVLRRVRQRTISDLLLWLPRMGFVVETCQLLETARTMERQHPAGLGAVTEFDELFHIGYEAIVECLIHSAPEWAAMQIPAATAEGEEQAQGSVTLRAEEQLVQALEQVTEALLGSWLKHSQTLRLSILERVAHRSTWENVVQFIEKYGGEIFTQQFLAMGNIRGILLQGVDAWLQAIRDEPHLELRLLDAIERDIPLQEVTNILSLILESIVENYSEYRDYNSTTTQSDRGELLYTLLDFLRLRVRYDRICWNLRPVVLAHKLLISHNNDEAAHIWRQSLTERIQEEADMFVSRLKKLQTQYSIRMRTVADRVDERFVRSMEVDHLRSLVKPSLEESKDIKAGRPSFNELLRMTEELLENPSGAGLEVPSWLIALEEEIEVLRYPNYIKHDEKRMREVIPQTKLSYDELQQQLTWWLEQQ